MFCRLVPPFSSYRGGQTFENYAIKQLQKLAFEKGKGADSWLRIPITAKKMGIALRMNGGGHLGHLPNARSNIVVDPTRSLSCNVRTGAWGITAMARKWPKGRFYLETLVLFFDFFYNITIAFVCTLERTFSCEIIRHRPLHTPTAPTNGYDAIFSHLKHNLSIDEACFFQCIFLLQWG